MSALVSIEARPQLEAWLRRDPGLHIYELGDLDPFFFPYTQWYGLRAGDEPDTLRALALLYTGAPVPTLLALGRPANDLEPLVELLEALAPQLPPRLYAHLAPGLCPVLARAGFTATLGGPHLRLVLGAAGREALRGRALGDCEQLDASKLDELLEFYARSYPNNWFDPRMLATGQYLGLRRNGALACVGGIHVYSPAYGVAALGNVTSAPEQRGQGLASELVAALCAQLLTRVEIIGLNVHADNTPALACYRRLGFELLAPFEEWGLARPGS